MGKRKDKWERPCGTLGIRHIWDSECTNPCYRTAMSADFYRVGLESFPLARSLHRTCIQKTYVKFKALQRPLGNSPSLLWLSRLFLEECQRPWRPFHSPVHLDSGDMVLYNFTSWECRYCDCHTNWNGLKTEADPVGLVPGTSKVKKIHVEHTVWWQVSSPKMKGVGCPSSQDERETCLAGNFLSPLLGSISHRLKRGVCKGGGSTKASTGHLWWLSQATIPLPYMVNERARMIVFFSEVLSSHKHGRPACMCFGFQLGLTSGLCILDKSSRIYLKARSALFYVKEEDRRVMNLMMTFNVLFNQGSWVHVSPRCWPLGC